MTKWKYIFASVCVFSFALIAASFSPAISQQKRENSYMIAAERGNYIWRVNVTDGSVTFCVRDGTVTSSQAYLAKVKPICSASSGPAGH